VERTQDGLAAARARGRKGGWKFKMTLNRAKQARMMYDAGQHTVQEIADVMVRQLIDLQVAAAGST
jgi:DNA invertase Pin-like site-specific DNA recombinase